MDVEVETCRIDDDSPALGKSLGELGIRQRTGVLVVALMRAGATESNPPNKSVLEIGDVLALLGTSDAIRKAIGLLVDSKPE